VRTDTELLLEQIRLLRQLSLEASKRLYYPTKIVLFAEQLEREKAVFAAKAALGAATLEYRKHQQNIRTQAA
jgi:hypothetical protein